jgi:hypothetical protein
MWIRADVTQLYPAIVEIHKSLSTGYRVGLWPPTMTWASGDVQYDASVYANDLSRLWNLRAELRFSWWFSWRSTWTSQALQYQKQSGRLAKGQGRQQSYILRSWSEENIEQLCMNTQINTGQTRSLISPNLLCSAIPSKAEAFAGYIFLLLPAPENLPTASLQDSVRRIGHSRRDKEKRTSNASGIQHLWNSHFANPRSTSLTRSWQVHSSMTWYA